MALTSEPASAEIPAAGGKSVHKLTNGGAGRIAFKIKSSNNNELRLKPVFGFVEPGASADVEITRLAGAPKDDKIVIHFAEVQPDCAKPEDAFAGGATGSGNLTIPVSAK
ncbi:MSP domain and PapD-like domain-containing protein [Strongyloides ratti]|uniref:MSP domain and PapD-like domain-containing protein n=1 Tax=Strongyloides ratti TaxID=34506 RepID=A0A090L982_STRRB|nr:MSP domain and PapD-like domain-containing protein [Strongyloides ratti]CEF66341.1 MSP domain and PapD-like domain-containing protein [Strongyloides ratti]